jgi:hypothetical protein
MIRASFSIVVPEETFSPQVHPAIVCDVSERGAMVVADFPEATYRALLTATRYCRLKFLDEPQLPDRVIGKAVYFQPVTKPGRVEYKVGLFFEEMPPAALERLRRFVAKKLAEEQAGPPAR